VFDYSGGLPADFMERNVESIMQEYPEEFSEVMQELQMTDGRKSRIFAILEEFLEDKNMASNWLRSMDTTITRLNFFQEKYSPVNAM
jgi:hypothetical protein